MAITIFGRGIPLSAVDDGSTLSIAYGGTAILDITSSGLSGTIAAGNATTLTATTVKGTNITGTGVSGTTVSATTTCGSTVMAATVCGTVANSAFNSIMTYAGGNSATLSGTPGTIAVCADRFLRATINGKTFYIPAFASAGTFSA